MIPLVTILSDLAVFGARIAVAELDRRDPETLEEIRRWLAMAQMALAHQDAGPALQTRLREQIREMTRAQAQIMRRRAAGGEP